VAAALVMGAALVAAIAAVFLERRDIGEGETIGQ
jgi:hypothetical protein